MAHGEEGALKESPFPPGESTCLPVLSVGEQGFSSDLSGRVKIQSVACLDPVCNAQHVAA